MKTVKGLLLGSAAALAVMGGAQAADLPVKAKPVEYVKICSLYGAGFYYIPGTDTCIKFGGYLRSDLIINSNTDDIGNVSLPGGGKNRFTNAYTWRSREDFNIDTRTQTEYGVLRTFADMTFSWTTDNYVGLGAGGTAYGSAIGVGNNAIAGAVAGGTLGVYYAFIQFAGFTIGKAISQFSMPWVNYPANNFDGLVGGGGTVTGVNQFTYTWDFGGGNSFAISAQDQVAYYQAGIQNLGGGLGPFFGILGTPGSVFGVNTTANTIVPDFVAMFRTDQANYMFQVSAAAHDNHAAYYTTGGLLDLPLTGLTGLPVLCGAGTECSGHPDDLWGFAVAAGFTIKNIPTGPGDTFNAQAVFTRGATRYNIQDLAGQDGAVSLFGSSGNPLAVGSFALNLAPDTVLVNGSNQHPVTTYGGQFGYNHNWSPYWSSGFYGAAAAVRYDDASTLAICGPLGNGLGGSFSNVLLFAGEPNFLGNAFFGVDGVNGHGVCNPNYEIFQLGTVARWTPVKGLTFSGDLTWQGIRQHNEGLFAFTSVTSGKSLGLYEFKNEQNVLLMLRAQRNW
jgi:hypothetical protein